MKASRPASKVWGPANLRTTNLKSSDIRWDVANLQRKAANDKQLKGFGDEKDHDRSR
jgi:hypothetical protein